MDKIVTIIGGIAVDIEGIPYNPLIYKDSNPGSINISFGGVGRNIAENLNRLGLTCNMVSAVGTDIFGESILKHLKEIGLSREYIDVVETLDTAVYLSILEDNRDMDVAINAMDIFSHWQGNKSLFQSESIANSSVIVVDTNITTKLIEEILTEFKDKTFILDPVSVTKARKVKDIIGKFHIIKPNKLEAEELSGIKINSEDDLSQVGHFFCEKGVKNIFITLGEAGVYYRDCLNKEGIIRVKPVLPVSTTGSGDAFTAGIAYGFLHSLNIERIAKYGCACSYFALTSEKAVNNQMTEERIKKHVEENY